ncbi:hypothetical protein CJ739_2546 [Mariniflexile rhizosphaerae]|uniref:hypothetical protein n=1 Tax=unclassified Mariniflexile TaxID=2643887 RepID=UPI000CC334CF|nr:hypothetical protein [Mariniflexile sp. TRM1-10]AXP81619.1 hypothetical protein CJ739_2546 [Mariniflexile sp. TRM1-10]PLB17615.1 MAG: hypothetical protein TRG1_3552 [Flavobacteriaceae bacterium FS1-H7996/R]
MIKWKSYYLVIVIMVAGLLSSFFLLTRQSNFYNGLEKIHKKNSYDIQVKEAYNERGIYVLNKKYYINSATYVIGNHYGLSKDSGIWRPENVEYNPRISDISAPFTIKKEIDNDTLTLKKGDKTILLLLVTD